MISPDRAVTTLAGSTQGHHDGQGAAAEFNWPRGIAFDASGDLLVADCGGHTIRKVAASLTPPARFTPATPEAAAVPQFTANLAKLLDQDDDDNFYDVFFLVQGDLSARTRTSCRRSASTLQPCVTHVHVGLHGLQRDGGDTPPCGGHRAGQCLPTAILPTTDAAFVAGVHDGAAALHRGHCKVGVAGFRGFRQRHCGGNAVAAADVGGFWCALRADACLGWDYASCLVQDAFRALLACLYTDTMTFEEASVVDLACLAQR